MNRDTFPGTNLYARTCATARAEVRFAPIPGRRPATWPSPRRPAC
jgi:hypothetical protein